MKLTPSTCPLDCPDACGVLLETDEQGQLARVRGNPAHGWSAGHLCSKTSIFADCARDPERLTQPLVRARDGALRPASWREALELVARRLKPLRGEQLLALSYAGNMGVIQRGYPARVLNALGATHTDGGICDSSATVGFETVLGHVIGPDIERARESDLLVIWGADARRTHQHLMPVARELLRRGEAVVVIDIYESDTLRTVRGWGGSGLIVAPGTDAALALCLARLTFEAGRQDAAFLRDKCVGGQEFERHVLSAHGLEDSARVTGLSSEEIRVFHAQLLAARRPFLKTGVGWTRRRNGAMSMRAVCSLAAVQGCAERVHFESGANFALDDDCVRRPELRPAGAPSAPIRHVELGPELASARFQAVVVWGHNPLLTVPNSAAVRAGLEREDLFLVVHELFLTETAQLADVVLPATSFAEHFDVFKSYSHRRLQYSRRAAEPWGEARSNVDCFRALGRELGLAEELGAQTDEELCLEYLEANRERIGEEALARVLAGEPTQLSRRATRDWGTPSGKVELRSEAAARLGQPALASYLPDDGCGGAGSHWLLPAPSVATHNSTYLHSGRHARRRAEAVLFMNPAELLAAGLEQGQRVRVENEHGRLVLPVRGCDQMPPGIVRLDGLFAPEELGATVGVNGLTSSSISDLGEGSVQFSHRVSIHAL